MSCADADSNTSESVAYWLGFILLLASFVVIKRAFGITSTFLRVDVSILVYRDAHASVLGIAALERNWPWRLQPCIIAKQSFVIY